MLADLGGEEHVSEVMAQLVEDFAFAAVLRDLLSAYLAASGPLTRAGKRRAALGAWHRASSRVEALARRIGTDRVPAEAESVEEYVSRKSREARAAREQEAASSPRTDGDDPDDQATEPDPAPEARVEPPTARNPGPQPPQEPREGAGQGGPSSRSGPAGYVTRAVPLPGLAGIPEGALHDPGGVAP